MPEYPDIVVYIERISHVARGQRLTAVRLAHPFLLRTAEPPIASVDGLVLQDLERIGKRIVFCLEESYYLVLHLMISGRLQWREPGCTIPRKRGLAALDFESGSLLITEASTKKRAALHLVQGRSALEAFDRGGLEILEAPFEAFRAAIKKENHTLKRTLTDQRILSGIGNAYSDEILFRARLSPFVQTKSMGDKEIGRLYRAAREVLVEWTERLRKEVGDGFPKRVTAFHAEMAVHGKYGEPCPVCGKPVQRIRYATRETNYCAQCQTGGRLLADRSLSRLLKDDWPRTLEELEERER